VFLHCFCVFLAVLVCVFNVFLLFGVCFCMFLCVFCVFFVFSRPRWLHSDPEGVKCGKTHVFLCVFEATKFETVVWRSQARSTKIK
jgi:hypothetical protein